jgi:hypothetical protein
MSAANAAAIISITSGSGGEDSFDTPASSGDVLAREFRKGLYWGVGIASVLFILLSVFFILLLRGWLETP